MNLPDIAKFRLASQQISETKFKTAKDVVGWMGAMQAQDYAMTKWAVGVRLANTTDQVIETAINNGEIIRTHLLRPTWHLVSADDIYWALELTAPRVKISLQARDKELGLTESNFSKSNTVLEKALRDRKNLTREEIITEFEKAGLITNGSEVSHLLLRAELERIVCSGAIKGGKPTYALLEERVPKTKSLTKEEALANLAKKYFTSHGPATIQDFIWWSGLSVNNAKLALEMAKGDLIPETINSQTFWIDKSFSTPKIDRELVYFLPAFDEFIISYKDRSASLPFENHNKTVSSNGVFRPIIVVNGQVIGIWKRTVKNDRVIIEIALFEQSAKNSKSAIENAAIQFGQFLEKKTEILFGTTYQ
jgi:hypothetical protein